MKRSAVLGPSASAVPSRPFDVMCAYGRACSGSCAGSTERAGLIAHPRGQIRGMTRLGGVEMREDENRCVGCRTRQERERAARHGVSVHLPHSTRGRVGWGGARPRRSAMHTPRRGAIGSDCAPSRRAAVPPRSATPRIHRARRRRRTPSAAASTPQRGRGHSRPSPVSRRPATINAPSGRRQSATRPSSERLRGVIGCGAADLDEPAAGGELGGDRDDCRLGAADAALLCCCRRCCRCRRRSYSQRSPDEIT